MTRPYVYGIVIPLLWRMLEYLVLRMVYSRWDWCNRLGWFDSSFKRSPAAEYRCGFWGNMCGEVGSSVIRKLEDIY